MNYQNLEAPSSFVIPQDDESWPTKFWGIKLGRTLNNIRNNGAFSEYRNELEGMGFNFDSKQVSNTFFTLIILFYYYIYLIPFFIFLILLSFFSYFVFAMSFSKPVIILILSMFL